MTTNSMLSSSCASSERVQLNGVFECIVKNTFIHASMRSPEKTRRATSAPQLGRCMSKPIEDVVSVPLPLSRCTTPSMLETCYDSETDVNEMTPRSSDWVHNASCTHDVCADPSPYAPAWVPHPSQLGLVSGHVWCVPSQSWLQDAARLDSCIVANGQFQSQLGPMPEAHNVPLLVAGDSQLSSQQEVIHQIPMTANLDWNCEWEIIDGERRPFEPHTVTYYGSRQTPSVRVKWTISAKKLNATDRSAVSPEIKLSDGTGGTVPFKMMLTPVQVSTQKNGSSFSKAKGKAIVQLKCQVPMPESHGRSVRFSLSATDGRQPCPESQRGPVSYDLSDSGLRGLAEDQAVWNLREHVHEEAQTFAIFLESTTI